MTDWQKTSVTADEAPPPSPMPFRIIFLIFLKLGLTCFGGPIAHLGYFRAEFVNRRRWLSEESYGDLVALGQFLPGPASSQVGFAIGLLRGGVFGGLAAWLGFTLPSAILLVLFARGAADLSGPVMGGILHGLKIVAVAVVAQAVWGMARQFCPDRQRGSIALAAVLAVVFLGGTAGQLLAILLGAAAGFHLCRPIPAERTVVADHHVRLSAPVGRIAAFAILIVVLALLLLLPLLHGLGWGDHAELAHATALFDAFYRAGALVFGGGHVVLPLLQESVVQPGWVAPDAFLAGYGAAQAVPGPLFTFAAYLGAINNAAPDGWIGAGIALIGIFLPGLLLILAALPFWDHLRRQPAMRAILNGVNAAVVGLLAAALYDPVWISAIRLSQDFALALLCFILLAAWKAQPWIVVLIGAIGGISLTLI